MQVSLPDVFLIPAAGDFLLYAPQRRMLAEVNGPLAKDLQRWIVRPEQPFEGASEPVRRIIEGLLSAPVCHPKTASGRPFSPAQLGLLLTNRCNLRCVYCYANAGEAEPLDMPEELALAALDFYAQRVVQTGRNSLDIYFHGGEPFLAWSTVQAVANHARILADKAGLPLNLSASTNGVMSAERAEWVADHFAHITLSVDGPPPYQNSLRPRCDGGPSFEAVDATAQIFAARGTEFVPRCTVTRDNVVALPEIVDFFCSRYGVKEISIEPVTPCGRSSRNIAPLPDEFVSSVVEAGRVCRAAGARLCSSLFQHVGMMRAPCPVCYDAFIVTPDGLVSSCHSVNERGAEHANLLSFGEFDAKRGAFYIDTRKLEKIRSWGVERIVHCRSCFAKWNCGAGCRVVHTLNLGKRPAEVMCGVIRKLVVWRLLCELGRYERADSVV